LIFATGLHMLADRGHCWKLKNDLMGRMCLYRVTFMHPLSPSFHDPTSSYDLQQFAVDLMELL